ncbi:MAG: GNAT family N-acetyltransferase [Clostridia bacterium]|nr:GNAT family N-acetyltransferase [Clostridia bacterium]
MIKVDKQDYNRLTDYLLSNYMYYIHGALRFYDNASVYVDNLDNINGVVYVNQFGQEYDICLYSRDNAFLDQAYKLFIRGKKVFFSATEQSVFDYIGSKRKLRRYTLCSTVINNGGQPPEYTVPNGLTMDKVRNEYLGVVVEHHEYYGSIDDIRQSVDRYPSVALYNSEGKMVSWVLVHPEGSIGPLFTLKEYRGKGLAPIVLAELIRQLLSQHHIVYSYIVKGNTSSEVLLKKVCGVFAPIDICYGMTL